MIPVLLIAVPLLMGLISFFTKDEKVGKSVSLFSSIAVLVITIVGLTTKTNLFFNAEWMPLLGSNFSVGIDGMGKILVLLTAVSFPLIFVATWNRSYTNGHNFHALMQLAQAGLMGVFVAYDALLFYFF